MKQQRAGKGWFVSKRLKDPGLDLSNFAKKQETYNENFFKFL